MRRNSQVIGRSGGWNGYEGLGYKPAGPITMAHGLVRFDAIGSVGKSQEMCDSLRVGDRVPSAGLFNALY